MRDYKSREGAAYETETVGPLPRDDRRRQVTMRRRAQAGNAEEKALAGQYRQLMCTKVSAYQATVAQAAEIFEAEQLQQAKGAKPFHLTDALIGVVVGQVLSQLGGLAARGAGMLGKLASMAVGKTKGAYEVGISASNELEVIKAIVAATNRIGRTFVVEAHAAIALISDEEAATNMRMLNATLASPAVEAEAENDSAENGRVRAAVTDQFLEADDAPLTGPAAAQELAMGMARAYQAERIKLAGNAGERADATQAALADPSKRAIPKATDDVGLTPDVERDKLQRDRASGLVQP
jgi:hypothetical protein